MIFHKTKLEGVYVIELEKNEDSRGFFARAFDAEQFKAQGLKSEFVQTNVSYSKKRGTLRGLHFQKEPFAEAKLVRCIKGALYDVVVDLRRDSPTYKKWFGAELSAENFRQVYVPEGFAHGFLTLEEGTEASYLVSQYYHPEAEGGIRYDDPAFGIKWPIPVEVISDKDRSRPDFKD